MTFRELGKKVERDWENSGRASRMYSLFGFTSMDVSFGVEEWYEIGSAGPIPVLPHVNMSLSKENMFGSTLIQTEGATFAEAFAKAMVCIYDSDLDNKIPKEVSVRMAKFRLGIQ